MAILKNRRITFRADAFSSPGFGTSTKKQQHKQQNGGILWNWN
jgi:hypothetical protein